MSLFGDILGGIFGEGPSTSIIPASQLIPPPSPQEQTLLNNLMSISSNIMNTPFNWGLYNQTLGAYNNAQNQLGQLAQGHLPKAFNNEINYFFKNQLGSTLNSLANRGIINSSVGASAIAGAMDNAFNQKMSYIPTLASLDLRIPQLAQNAFNLGTNAPLNFYNQQASLPLQMWGHLSGLRYQAPNQIVEQPGTPGLLGSVLGGLGIGLGGALGKALGGLF